MTLKDIQNEWHNAGKASLEVFYSAVFNKTNKNIHVLLKESEFSYGRRVFVVEIANMWLCSSSHDMFLSFLFDVLYKALNNPIIQ